MAGVLAYEVARRTRTFKLFWQTVKFVFLKYAPESFFILEQMHEAKRYGRKFSPAGLQEVSEDLPSNEAGGLRTTMGFIDSKFKLSEIEQLFVAAGKEHCVEQRRALPDEALCSTQVSGRSPSPTTIGRGASSHA